jgi:hypothetical protein
MATTNTRSPRDVVNGTSSRAVLSALSIAFNLHDPCGHARLRASLAPSSLAASWSSTLHHGCLAGFGEGCLLVGWMAPEKVAPELRHGIRCLRLNGEPVLSRSGTALRARTGHGT